MNDVITNHLNMARRCVACLELPEHSAIWAAVPPMAFGAKVAAVKSRIAEMETIAQAQTRNTTGTTEDKAREERELVSACLDMGGSLVMCCRDANDLTTAAPFDLKPYQWKGLRDEILLQRARDLKSALDARIAADPVTAQQYDINPASVADFQGEIDDFAAFIVEPDNAINSRKGATQELEEKDGELLEDLEGLDRLIYKYRKAPGGPSMITKYKLARSIIDRGHGPSPGPPAPPVP